MKRRMRVPIMTAMNRGFAFGLVLLAAQALSPLSAQTMEQQVLERLNVVRWDNGQLPPMKGVDLLDNSAEAHSQAMADRNFFMHCDPDTGTRPNNRMTAAGYAYSGWAENIAAGYSTAEAVMTGWMNSSGHRANMLGGHREVGIGYVFQSGDQPNVRSDMNGDCIPDGSGGGYGAYWTQNFGSRSNVYPLVLAREAYQTAICSVDVYLYGGGWATQFRLSNDGTNWSAWTTFVPNALWLLDGTAGSTVTVQAQLRNASGTVLSASDRIRLVNACTVLPPDPPVFANGFE